MSQEQLAEYIVKNPDPTVAAQVLVLCAHCVELFEIEGRTLIPTAASLSVAQCQRCTGNVVAAKVTADRPPLT